MSDKPQSVIRGEKLRGAEKMARIPVKIEPTEKPGSAPSRTPVRACST